MSGDIVDDLRRAIEEIGRLRMTVIAEVGAQQEQTEEVARLRRLITEWADAEDAYSHAAQWREWDTIGEDQQRFEVAENELRKAVGR